MKRSFVFMLAILLVLFLLNSFVLKEEGAMVKPGEHGKLLTGNISGKAPTNRNNFSITVLRPKNPTPKYVVTIELKRTRILSIQQVPNDRDTPRKSVNFSISIQRPDTFFNIPVFEYMGTVQQADLNTILKSCYFGDVILLRTSGAGEKDSTILKIKVDRIKQLGKPKGRKEGGC